LADQSITIIDNLDEINTQAFLTGFTPQIFMLSMEKPAVITPGKSAVWKLGGFQASYLCTRASALFVKIQIVSTKPFTDVHGEGQPFDVRKQQIRMFDQGTLSLPRRIDETSNHVQINTHSKVNLDNATDIANLVTTGYKNEATLYGCTPRDAPYAIGLHRTNGSPERNRSRAVWVQIPLDLVIDNIGCYPAFKSRNPYQIKITFEEANTVFKAYLPGQTRRYTSTANGSGDIKMGYPYKYIPDTENDLAEWSYEIVDQMFLAYCLTTHNQARLNQIPMVIWADVTTCIESIDNGNAVMSHSISWPQSNVNKIKAVPSFVNINQTQHPYILSDDGNHVIGNIAYYEFGGWPNGGMHNNHTQSGLIYHYLIDIFGKQFPRAGGCGSMHPDYVDANYPFFMWEIDRFYGKASLLGNRERYRLTVGDETAWLNTPLSTWTGSYYPHPTVPFGPVQGTGSDPYLTNPDAQNPLWYRYTHCLGSGDSMRYAPATSAWVDGLHLSAKPGGNFMMAQNFNTLPDSDDSLANGISASNITCRWTTRRSSPIDEDMYLNFFITSRFMFTLRGGGTAASNSFHYCRKHF
jgi:hypothetical protein